MRAEEIVEGSVRRLAQAIAKREVGAVEVTRAVLDRIAALDGAIHAWRLVDAEGALAVAKAIDADRGVSRSRGPLAGVPCGLKDVFVTKDLETTAGSRILSGWIPPYDGTHAARLREAGAVVLGKLAMDEFAMGSSNENTPDAPVRNPWDRTRVAGGSSGGSAAAVAARMVPFALGSDTGGSVRQPAGFCNLVGLKPTYGRISRHGMVAFASSFDQAGPMTRDVRDAALVYSLLAGPDPRDATCIAASPGDPLSACEAGARGLRVGVVSRALEGDGMDPATLAAFRDALRTLETLGAELVEVELPHFDYAIATYYVLVTAEAASNLARYDGVRYGRREEATVLSEMYDRTREAGFGPEVKRRILLGTFVLRKDGYEAYYGRAARVRSLITRDYAQAFARCDVLASPVAPAPAFPLGTKHRDPLAMYLSDVFTIGANLAGVPAISVPGGFVAGPAGNPLPVGLQFIAPHLREDTLFRVAAAYEDATGFGRRAPPDEPASAGEVGPRGQS